MKITADTTIAQAIAAKGPRAGEVIDMYLCNSERTCCPGTSLTLGFAAEKMGKQGALHTLLHELNAMQKGRGLGRGVSILRDALRERMLGQIAS